ncbi:ABC transporter substrate-binding protein [Cohnella terricola]|uniref:Extracellular solute-binding protein n=1 Tax=Cohnella terricola TaxID=1289167 RepID=A0A559JGU9_9BACL|nr:extracellular solute-binding protein [Cohnella terricola]TVX99103.1 extracellular solute-binding protein [Cohnella terricola]
MYKNLALISFLLIGMFLSGCQIISKEKHNEQGTLVVLDTDEQRFRTEYLGTINRSYPKLEVVLVPYENYRNEQTKQGNLTNQEILSGAIEYYLPDIIIARERADFKKLMSDNRLAPLDRGIKSDKYDQDPLDPKLISSLRGDDGLQYALSSHFTSTVLYYNQSAFQQAGVATPNDGMTWEEVYLTAARFSGNSINNNKEYGLYLPNANSTFSAVLNLAYEQGIGFFTPKKELALRTPEWVKVWETVTKAVTSGALFPFGQDAAGEDPIKQFSEGKIAMIYGDDRLIAQIINRKADWAMVSEPIHSKQPDVGNNYRYLQYMGLSVNAPHRDLAWEVMKLLNGEKAALSFSGQGIPIRKAVANIRYNHLDLKAFYSLRPRDSEFEDPAPTGLDPEFYLDLYSEGDKKVKEVIENKVTIDQALLELEELGQVLVKRYTKVE